MKKLTAFCLLFVPLAALAIEPPLRPGVNSDAEIAAKLVGTWMRDEPSLSSQKTFAADGTAIGFIQDFDAEGNPTDRVEFQSTWQVTDGHLIGEVIKTTNEALLPAGYKFADEIVSVSDERFVFLEDGMPVLRQRKP